MEFSVCTVRNSVDHGLQVGGRTCPTENYGGRILRHTGTDQHGEYGGGRYKYSHRGVYHVRLLLLRFAGSQRIIYNGPPAKRNAELPVTGRAVAEFRRRATVSPAKARSTCEINDIVQRC